MRIRHLRYFLVVAEEQNFSRAAARVYIDPSPLSRAIKDLEAQLGVQLFQRTNGRLQLTWSGEVFREEARRILSSIENAKIRVHSAANGYRTRLQIGLADGLAQPQLTRLLTLSREEEPTTELRIIEMTVSEIILAITRNEIDAGFTMDGESVDNLCKTFAWKDPAVIAIPTRHPLLALDKIPLCEALRYPLILGHPEQCAGGYKVIKQWLNDKQLSPPIVAEYVSSHEPMMMLVAAGYGIGIGLQSQLALYNYPDVVVRSILDSNAFASTFIVTPSAHSSPSLERFMKRAQQIGATLEK